MDGQCLRYMEKADIPVFLELAKGEGWLCDPWEFEFLATVSPLGCLTITEDGRPLAFVTTIAHGADGWIGNLLVARDCRRKGLGRLLFERALDYLSAVGVANVWLTASPAGRMLYEKLGFQAIDTIWRWGGKGVGGGGIVPSRVRIDELAEFDAQGWGAPRINLLEAVVQRGGTFLAPCGFMVLQPMGAGIQIGPWGVIAEQSAAWLLDQALAWVSPGVNVTLDTPGGNRVMAPLLASRGFCVKGETVLMCRGAKLTFDPRCVCALASLGSMG